MKKLLSAVLAVMLLAGLCTTAFAVGTDTLDINNEVPVSITTDQDVKHKYSADIDYDNPMVFTYTSKTQWNPKDYTYDNQENAAAPGWSPAKNVRITNHSDMPVKFTATATVTNNSYGDLDIVVTGGSGTIEKCTPTTQLGSMFADFTVGVAGIPTAGVNVSQVTLGTLNIRITSF